MSHTEFTSHELRALGQTRLWPRFLLFPFMAVIGYIAFANGWAGNHLMVRALGALFLGFCWFCVSGSFHETVHQTLGRQRWANVWGGRLIGTLLGIPYSVYRETHIRHHAYMNTPDDWELWPYSDPRASLSFRRAFVWFDIFGAVVSAPIIYGRIYFAKHSPLSRQSRTTITREYVAVAVFWGGVVTTIVMLNRSGVIELKWTGLELLLPLVFAAGFNTLRKFTEHLGMASYDPILGTRTVIGSNWLTRLCSYFNFEEFVHGPHHRFPRAPHHELSSKMEEYKRQHPDAAVPLFSSYRAALCDMLPYLFRNPGTGVNVGGQVRYQHRRGVDNFVSDVEASVLCNEIRHVA